MSESNPILEKSLDEIIGDKKPERGHRGPSRGGPRRGGPRNERSSRGRGVNKPVCIEPKRYKGMLKEIRNSTTLKVMVE